MDESLGYSIKPGKVALRTANGQYLGAEEGEGKNRYVCAWRTGDPGDWETFGLIERGGNKIALRTANGQYVGAEEGGGKGKKLVAWASGIGAWEIFDLVDLEGMTVALRTYDGKYVSAKDKIDAKATGVGQDELFSLIKITDNKVAFRASNGKYVRLGDGKGLVADQDWILPSGTFERIGGSDGEWGFKGPDGGFWCATNGNVVATSDQKGQHETFIIEIPESIQKAIDAICTGCTIMLNEGVYRQNVKIDKPVNLVGAGIGKTFVDGNNNGPVFTIGKTNPNIDVRISGMVIRGGSSRLGGGINNSGRLTVEDSRITGNDAINGGGGIYNEDGIVTVSDSSITGNSAQWGSGILGYKGKMTLNRDSITENSATSGGGGIHVVDEVLTINKCVITGNRAELGAGIINDRRSELTLIDVTIQGNIARTVGGGMWTNATMYFKGGEIDENQPDNVYYKRDDGKG